MRKNCNPKKSYPCGSSCQSNSHGGSCEVKFSFEISNNFLELKGDRKEIERRKEFSKNKADRIKNRLKDKGEITEEQILENEKQMRDAFNNSSTYIAVPQSALNKIIKTGRIKTVFEVSNERGDEDGIEVREEMEEDLFDIDSQNRKERPIYGYRGKSHQNQEVEMYGTTKLKIKKDKDKDSTFCVGDSFATETASPLDNPSFGAMYTGSATSRKFFQQPGSISNDPNDWTENYTEIQIHGGVSAKDIESIIIPKGTEITKEMEESGIPIEYY